MMRRTHLLLLLAALACAPPPGGAQTASPEDGARRFVRDLDLPGLHAEVLLVDRPSGLTFFRVARAVQDESIHEGYALSDGRRAGWLDATGPRGARFPLTRRDAWRFTPRLLARIQAEQPDLWPGVASRLAADSATSPAALAWLIEKDETSREHLLRTPRVLESLDLLAHFPEPRSYEWRRATLDLVVRRGHRVPARHLDWILRLAPITDHRAAIALIEHPSVRFDAERLLTFTDFGVPETARLRAMRRLLRLPGLSSADLRRFNWWEAAPELIEDQRVRRDTEVLYRIRWGADPSRFKALRTQADRLLLWHTGTNPQTILAIASESATNAHRCRPLDYPSREFAAAALRHPRARENTNIPYSFVWLAEYPEVRAEAFRMLYGREPPPLQSRAGYELAWLRTAYTQALNQIDMTDDWSAAIAVLDRWDARGLHPVESAAWRSILSRATSSADLFRLVREQPTTSEAMLRANPLLALIPLHELNDLGIACDLLDR